MSIFDRIAGLFDKPRWCRLLGHQYHWAMYPEPHRTCIWCGYEKIYD